MDQLVAASLAQLSRSHSVADGATTLTCLARYYITHNYRLPDERLAALLAALQPGLRSGSPGDLVSLLHSAMCLSHMPPRPFMMDYYAVLKDRLAAEPAALSHADFSRLLWSLSRVDCVPPRRWAGSRGRRGGVRLVVVQGSGVLSSAVMCAVGGRACGEVLLRSG